MVLYKLLIKKKLKRSHPLCTDQGNEYRSIQEILLESFINHNLFNCN